MKIAVSYVVEPIPEPFSFFPPEPRHDIVIIDSATWSVSLPIHKEAEAVAWSSDSKSLALYWFNGPDGSGIYTTEVNYMAPAYLSQIGVLSPDFGKIALFEDPFVKITSIQSQDVREFMVPSSGRWYIYSWSPDMNQLALVYREREEDRFENIYILDLNSGSFSQFTNDDKYFKNSLSFSPDGKLIAYITRRFTENDIEKKLLISKLDQSCEWNVPVDNVDYFAWSPDGEKMFLSSNDGVYLADLNIIFDSGFPNGNHCP
jgi:Tol biopolymer transport system component